MVRLVVLLTLAGAIVLAPSVIHATEVREGRPNLMGGELLGRAPLLSVGYERYLTNHIGIGAGIGYMPELPDQTTERWSFPLYVSIIPVGDTHSPYLSAGVKYTYLTESERTLLNPFLSGGYQYQSDRGFFLRATVTWLEGGAHSPVVIPGLALGYRF